MDTATGAISTIQTGFAALSALIVSYSLSAVGAIILLVAGYLLARLAERLLVAALGRIRGMDATLITFFSKIARYAILVLVMVMVLGQFGVQTASIIAAMGAIGLAIGLALQGTLQNIAAGIMLLVLRPLRIGEEIEVDSVAGTVEEIGLFASRLRSSEGVYILAPNSTLWNRPIRNYSRNGMRRREIEISVEKAVDVQRIQEALVALARSERRVLAQPAPEAYVSGLGSGDSGGKLTLRYWTSDKEVGRTEHALRSAIGRMISGEGKVDAGSSPAPVSETRLAAEGPAAVSAPTTA